MTTRDYRQALKTATEEKTKLLSQKNEIESRMAQLNQTIYTLTRLCGAPMESFEGQTGLTDAIRNIVRASDEPIGSLEVKNALKRMGFPISAKNPQAAVHTVLKRLFSQGEIEE